MAAIWNTVRVFISSTFRDMHAERDYLVKVVFPALREKLQKYRIHLIDIDLRWGITEEEAQRDRVLDLCLEQIDECRPFFVGILGERYGSVPRSFSDEALSKYGWVQYQTGKSVTELEILYGVLREPQMHARALFLFRDPAFIADVPEAKRADMMAEDAESAGKLRRLKQAICEAGLPIPPLENYPCQYAGLRINWRLARRVLDEAAQAALEAVAADGIVDPGEYGSLDDRLRPIVERHGVVHLTRLETFGRYVGEQLWRAIQAEHNLPEVPPVEAAGEADPLAVEQDYHERFIESRLRVYVGRENVQERLTAFAGGEATHPCLVTAPSGAGKSAALARFARSYAAAHPGVLVIPHFVGASPGSTSLRQMLRRFCLILKDRFGLAEEVPLDVNELVGRFRGSLESVPDGARIVLVIDALNQLDETDNAQSMWWLPWELPPRVKIIASCIDDPDCTEPVLQALAHRPLERVPIEPLTDAERREIVRRVPSLSAKTLGRRQVDLLLSNPATKNPLFLLVALEELRGFGSFEQLDTCIAGFPRPPEEGEPKWKQWLAESRDKCRSDLEKEPERLRQKLEHLDQIEAVLRDTPPVNDTITAIFDHVIERLREEFDDDVVRTVLALVACARSGMLERELLEMVEGMGVEESASDLFPVLRQLRPYLQHRGEMVDFFHRGLYKAVHERYLDECSARSYHRDLAGYFHAKLNPPGAEPWSGEYPRALSELPHHQTQGELWEPLEATLTALPFLEGKVTAGMTFELAGDFTAAVNGLPADRPQRRILRLLEEALRRDIHFIARHADDYPQGLFQCLWNTCWWYDCDQAAAHYEAGRPPGLPSPASGRGVGGEGGQPPRLQRDDQRLSRLLERWRQSKEHSSPGFPWLASRRPPPMHLGTAQLAVLRGHEKGVTSVAFSPGGDRIATGAGDKTVRVWDTQSGEELVTLRGHKNVVKSVAFSADGRRIASGAMDGTLRVWDAQSGAMAVLGLHEHRLAVDAVAFSPDGDRIASGARDKTVRVWDAQSGAELSVLRGHWNSVSSVAFSADGRRIASGAIDGTLRVWDAASGTELALLCGCAHEPDADLVESTAEGLAFWRAYGHGPNVESVAFSADGQRIASGCDDNTVQVWDAVSGAQLAVLRGHTSRVTSVAFSPGGDRIASGSWDKTVRVWDAATGAELALLRGHEDRVSSVAFNPDGRRIASVSDDNTVRVWDAQGGAELALLRGHEDRVSSVAFNRDGRRIASVSEDNTVRVWDAQSGAELAVLRGHEYRVTSATFSEDGRRIASGSEDTTVRVWDAQSGAQLVVLRGHDDRVSSVAFSADGRRIASGSDDSTLRVWDAQSGAELAVLHGHVGDVRSVAFSPDGQRIVSGSWGDIVQVWDAETDQCLQVIQGADDVADDVQAIAAGPAQFPLRALWRGQETLLERADGGQPVAWFPISLERITTHPNGRTWAGSSGNHVYIITLEGDL